MFGNVYKTTIQVNGETVYSSRMSGCCMPMFPPPPMPMIGCFGFGFGGYGFGAPCPRNFGAAVGMGFGFGLGMGAMHALDSWLA